MYFGLKFIRVLPTVCEEVVWALGAASGSCHDLRDHLVSSLLLQMRNQGQESRQDLIKVALDLGSLVTKQRLEFGQVAVVSQPLINGEIDV